MSDTPKIDSNCVISCTLLLVSIIFTCSFYLTCKESDNVSHHLTNWCFYICCWRVVTGVIIVMVKCGYEDENPGEKNCRSIAHCCSSLVSELPYILMSAVMYKNLPDEVCRGLNTDDVINALFWNSSYHLLPLLYRLIISCCKDKSNYWGLCATLHFAALIFVVFILFHPMIYC